MHFAKHTVWSKEIRHHLFNQHNIDLIPRARKINIQLKRIGTICGYGNLIVWETILALLYNDVYEIISDSSCFSKHAITQPDRDARNRALNIVKEINVTYAGNPFSPCKKQECRSCDDLVYNQKQPQSKITVNIVILIKQHETLSKYNIHAHQ